MSRRESAGEARHREPSWRASHTPPGRRGITARWFVATGVAAALAGFRPTRRGVDVVGVTWNDALRATLGAAPAVVPIVVALIGARATAVAATLGNRRAAILAQRGRDTP